MTRQAACFSQSTYTLFHISRQLHTFLRFFPNGTCSLTDALSFDRLQNFSDESLPEAILSLIEAGTYTVSPAMPLLMCIDQICVYALVRHPAGIFLLGPVRFDGSYHSHCSISMQELSDAPPFPDMHFPGGEEWFLHISLCDFTSFLDHVMLLLHFDRMDSENQLPEMGEILLHNCIKEDTIQITNRNLSRLIFESLESRFVHNPYNHEDRETAAITRGDYADLEQILQEDFTGRYGTLSDDPLKQQLYLGIVTITIASRAAIRGGLHPETAFYLSDNYIQAMDKASDIPTIIQLHHSAEIHYAKLVHELRSQSPSPSEEEETVNRHISHCKDYIYTHLHGRITVQEIADAIGLEPNYLSALFSKCEKMTLTDYIKTEKVKLIRNLLVYSNYSCTEIAAYLGYSSQSHMGKVFKEVTGMTPVQYRKKNQKEDFLGELEK